MLYGSISRSHISGEYSEFWKESSREFKIKALALEGVLIGAGAGLGAVASTIFKADTKTMMTAGAVAGGALGLFVFHAFATFEL